jgi:hypothetical protein
MDPLFAVGDKIHAPSHFLPCDTLPRGLAFALQFHVSRKCLQCDWHEQKCPGTTSISREQLNQESNSMEAIGLLVTLEARPGKEGDAEAFLKSALPLALAERETLKWYAIKLGPRKFGVFDTFASEDGRNAHLSGEIAKALGAKANELFATPPQIEKVEILVSTPLKK